jgi:hypothetical protein
MRLGVVLAVALAALAATAGPADACSCATPIDPRGLVVQADAAFVGTLVERHDPGDPDSFHPVTLVFRVDEALKGPLGATVEVTTSASSASCGIDGEIGRQAAVVLRRQGGAWTAGLCDQLDPAMLRAAARPLPSPNGLGPPAFVVGGRFGDVTTIALDGRLRTLAYGRGEGTVRALAVCPGGRRVAEAAWRPGGATLRVRKAAGLGIVRRWRIALPLQPAAVRCADPLGRRVDLFATSLDSPARARLLTASGDGVRTLWSGTALYASFAAGVAYLSAGSQATALVRLDLDTGQAARIASLPPYTGALVPNQAGTRLAAVASGARFAATPAPSRLVAVDLSRRPTARSVSLRSSLAGDVLWLRDGRLLLMPHGDNNGPRLFDRSLRPLGRLQGASTFSPGWFGGTTAVRDDAVVGVDYRGRLLRAGLPDGPVRAARLLPGPVVNALVAVET